MFTADLYSTVREGIKQSAAVLVPWMVDVFHPQSVLDVGCGEGWWLAEFKRLGVQQVCGLEGYDGPAAPGIVAEERLQADLIQKWPLQGKRFDLTMCLEVAEHLPESSAGDLVQWLTESSLGPIVFSAAIPAQGGYQHINEQWPIYWMTRFAGYGYRASDVVRRLFWNCGTIAPWYRQNTFVLCPEAMVADWPMLYNDRFNDILPMVHPVVWSHARGI